MRINDHEFNRLTVLKAIRRTEPIARTELPELTGLSGGTITELVADLVRRRVLIEEKLPAQGRGRPRVQLRMNPHGAYLVGAFMAIGGGLTVEIINLRGDRMYSQSSPMKPTTSLPALAEEIAAVIEATIAASPYSKQDLHRVGVTMPALLDNVHGVVYWLASYPMEPTPVAAIIERHLQLPVVIDNNSNVMARAEHWFGKEAHLDDFSLITVDFAMGSARYIEGMLWSGAHGLNPELSHSKMGSEHRSVCYCGARGCLVTHCSIWGIVTQICDLRDQAMPPYSMLRDVFEDIVREARDGDLQAQRIFADAGRFLGMAVSNQINASDPGRVIILGDQLLLDMLDKSFHEALRSNTLPVLHERTPVEIKLISDEHLWKGSAALVLEQLYRLPQ